MIEITRREKCVITDLIETMLFDAIRNDPEIDSMEWLCDVVSIYNKCKGGAAGGEE